jgi:formylglycine-generating enzyme required for sulfatase activity
MLGRYAWYFVNSSSTMHPVGTLKPNGLGLFDVHGNAWEWCYDRYEESKQNGPGEDKSSIIDNDIIHMLRGGSFNLNALRARSAIRLANAPADHYDGFGFRLARTCR